MTAPIKPEAGYVPGSWVAFAGTRVWLLADLDPADPVVERCWQLVRAGAGVDPLLEALAGSQVRPALHFAVVRVDGAEAEIAVHGDARADVLTTDAPAVDAAGTAAAGAAREVRASPGAFGTAVVERFTMVRLRAASEHPVAGGSQGAPTLFLGTGVVLAAVITLRASDAAATAALPAPVAPAPAAMAEAAGERNEFDTLFGPTRAPEPEPDIADEIPTEWLRGMRLPGGSPGPSAAGTPADPPAGPPAGPSAGPASAVDGAVIDDVSWAIITDHSADPPPPPAVWDGQLTGPAQSTGGGIDPELMKTTRRAPGRGVTPGPIVDAVRCADGHLNPPAAQRCRACAGPVPAQAPRPVPRPPLGVLRLSTDEVVTLDRGVVLGRAPGAPQGLGPDEPHRIQLPSPDGSISRKHVEVVLDGWQVTAVDLESTNGTVVISAGGASETLPSGGRATIHPGDVVSLDPTTWFRFEVTTS